MFFFVFSDFLSRPMLTEPNASRVIKLSPLVRTLINYRAIHASKLCLGFGGVGASIGRKERVYAYIGIVIWITISVAYVI